MFLLAFLLAVIVVLLAVVIFVSNMFYKLALGATANKSAFSSAPHSRIDIGEPDVDKPVHLREMQLWVDDTVFDECHITSDDKLKLHALAIGQPGNKWVIICHGYMNFSGNMKNTAYAFWHKGYSVLIPDARGHGASEGAYAGMGWHERHDIIRWIESITEKNPNAQIVLYGVSMGAATVLMTSGEKLPPNVVAVIEDSGYTSAWDEFKYELKALFGLPPFPFMYATSLIAKIRAGFWFHEASALNQVKKSSTPTLFIHGDADTLVPHEMVFKLYEASSAPKDLMVVETAGHCMSANVLGALYWEKVFSFIEKYSNSNAAGIPMQRGL